MPTRLGERPDDNALRLLVLRQFLNRGLLLGEAVKATNRYFRLKARAA